jgi:hypothetical protein
MTVGDYNDMRAVATELQTKLQADVDAGFTVTVGSTGTVTIAHSTDSFELRWKTGTTHGSDNDDSHCGTLLGFDDSANDTGASSYDSDNQHDLAYYHEAFVGFDSYDRPLKVGGATTVAVDGTAKRTTFGTHYEREIRLGFMENTKFFDADSDANESFEEFWLDASAGVPFLYYTSTDTWAGGNQYVMIVENNESLIEAARVSDDYNAYSYEWRMIKQ